MGMTAKQRMQKWRSDPANRAWEYKRRDPHKECRKATRLLVSVAAQLILTIFSISNRSRTV